MNEWHQWLRNNADKLLLLLAAFGFMVYSLHLAHRSMDVELEHTSLEYAGQAFAAFLTLCTGSMLRSGSKPPDPPA